MFYFIMNKATKTTKASFVSIKKFDGAKEASAYCKSHKDDLFQEAATNMMVSIYLKMNFVTMKQLKSFGFKAK